MENNFQEFCLENNFLALVHTTNDVYTFIIKCGHHSLFSNLSKFQILCYIYTFYTLNIFFFLDSVSLCCPGWHLTIGPATLNKSPGITDVYHHVWFECLVMSSQKTSTLAFSNILLIKSFLIIFLNSLTVIGWHLTYFYIILLTIMSRLA